MHRKRTRFIALAVSAASLGGFGLLADEVLEGDTLAFDEAVLAAMRQQDNQAEPIGPAWLAEAMRDITALGSFSVLAILVAAVVIFLVLTSHRRLAGFVTVAIIGGASASMMFKAIFDRPRPEIEGVARVFTASFPSGHAMVSAVVYLTLGAILADRSTSRKAKIFFFSFAGFLTFLVGFSRLYLGVHFPTDIVAGWSLGAAWALLSLIVLHYLEDRSSMQKRQIA